MKLLMAAGLLALAATAMAAKNVGPSSDIAKKHVDVTDVNLQAGKLFVNGVYDLAQRPETFDAGHAAALMNETRSAVDEARLHLGHLFDLAKGDWASAYDPLSKAKTDLASVDKMLRNFGPSIKGNIPDEKSIQATARDIWQSLDDAQKNVERAATDMTVDYKLKTP